MLLRLITVISLFNFMLLLISGIDIDVALYRSIIVFMILFTIAYLSIFFLNIIRETSESENTPVTEMNGDGKKQEE